MRFDRLVARGKMLSIGVKELEVLLQHEDVLGPIVAREGGDDLGFRGTTAMVAMLREVARIALSRDDVAEDAEARHAGDVCNHEG